MSDFDVVREAIGYSESEAIRSGKQWEDVLNEAYAALDRIEQDVAGLKVELADASADLSRLRRIEEAARVWSDADARTSWRRGPVMNQRQRELWDECDLARLELRAVLEGGE